MKTTKSFALASILFSLALTGCVTSTLSPRQKVFLYVTENHVVYNGESFTNLELDRIPERLRRAGARPETEIVLIPQGNVHDVYLKSIAGVCGHGRFPNVVIRERPKATAVTQRRGTGVKPQHGTKPPKFIPPNAKKKPPRDDPWRDFPEPKDPRPVKPPKR